MNAIQALSQLSYTPIFKALSQGRFTIIAKNKSIVKCSTEEKRKCVVALQYILDSEEKKDET